jgi:hypothetical protein
MLRLRLKSAVFALAASLAFLLPLSAQETKTAADIVPADCSIFTTSLKLREQFDAVANSKAVKKLMALKAMQEALKELKNNPEFKQGLEQLENPQVKEAMDLVVDAVSKEFFLYADNGIVDAFGLINEFQNRNSIEQIKNIGQEPKPAKVLMSLLAERKDIKLPTFVLGFKVTKADRFKQLIGMLPDLAALAPYPLKAEPLKTAAGEFLTFEFSLKAQNVPDQVVLNGLTGEGDLEEADAKKVLEFLKTKRIVLTIGQFKDYLIVGFGPSGDWAKNLGENSLAKSGKLAPIMKHVGDNTVAIGFTSKELAALGSANFGQFYGMIDAMSETFKDQMPEGLASRLKTDVKELEAMIAKSMPTPSDAVSVSNWNRGIETLSFSKSVSPGQGADKKLDLLATAGREPLLAVATSTGDSTEAMAESAKLFGKLKGYWKDFGAKMVPADQADQVAKFEKPVLAFVDQAGSIFSKKIMPACGAGQSLFAIDVQAKFQGLPFVLQLPKAVPMLEFSSVSTLKDGKAFEDGIGELFTATDALINELGKASPELSVPANFMIPRANDSPFGADGTMYMYPLAGMLGPSMTPHSVVMPNRLILSTSIDFSKRALKTGVMPTDSVVDLSKPASSISVCRPAGLWKAIAAWYDVAASMPNSPIADLPENVRAEAKEAVGVVVEVLGCFKGSASRTSKEGDWTVTHSWLNVEDLK